MFVACGMLVVERAKPEGPRLEHAYLHVPVFWLRH